MGILQIVNHMVCSTFRNCFFSISREISLHQICTEIFECAYCPVKRQICISLPPLCSKTIDYRWRVQRRGINVHTSFHGLPPPALQSPLICRNRAALNSMGIFFSQWTPIMGHLQWNERKTFSSLIKEYQSRKGNTRKMTTMKRKLKWFYWTAALLAT